MRTDKNQAIRLRKDGHSYNQISQILSVPKSTLSTWLKDLPLSSAAQEKINIRVHNTSIKALIRRNKEQTTIAQQRADTFRFTAKKTYAIYKNEPAFIQGVALYWAEGYKKGALGSRWKSIDFANSDILMIKFMITFFQRYLNVDPSAIKIQIIAHNNTNDAESLRYWQKNTNIPAENFMKVSHAKNINKKTKRINTLPYGTIHLRINNVMLFFTLIGWIDEMKKNI